MWEPTASLHALQQRAAIVKQLRLFFEERGVLEVETPLLCHSTATDPLLQSFHTTLLNGEFNPTLFLQTSPEFPMKRLLAAGVGSIYQITKAFRNGEIGRKHNPEFTLLEWYRVGFNYDQLMDEIDELLHIILKTKAADRISYRHLFEQYFGINPHTAKVQDLKEIAAQSGINLQSDEEPSKDLWLDLLISHLIEPNLGVEAPIFIYDYPDSQAALANIRIEENYRVGERFELYYKGMELANGYQELGDAAEQKSRFLHDNNIRANNQLDVIPLDKFLLQALPHLPHCSGVALGIDRLVCIALGKQDIAEVLSFPITRA